VKGRSLVADPPQIEHGANPRPEALEEGRHRRRISAQDQGVGVAIRGHRAHGHVLRRLGAEKGRHIHLTAVPALVQTRPGIADRLEVSRLERESAGEKSFRSGRPSPGDRLVPGTRLGHHGNLERDPGIGAVAEGLLASPETRDELVMRQPDAGAVGRVLGFRVTHRDHELDREVVGLAEAPEGRERHLHALGDETDAVAQGVEGVASVRTDFVIRTHRGEDRGRLSRDGTTEPDLDRLHDFHGCQGDRQPDQGVSEGTPRRTHVDERLDVPLDPGGELVKHARIQLEEFRKRGEFPAEQGVVPEANLRGLHFNLSPGPHPVRILLVDHPTARGLFPRETDFPETTGDRFERLLVPRGHGGSHEIAQPQDRPGRRLRVDPETALPQLVGPKALVGEFGQVAKQSRQFHFRIISHRSSGHSHQSPLNSGLN